MCRINCWHDSLESGLDTERTPVGHHVLEGRRSGAHLNIQWRALRLLSTLEGRDSLFDRIEIRTHVAVCEVVKTIVHVRRKFFLVLLLCQGECLRRCVVIAVRKMCFRRQVGVYSWRDRLRTFAAVAEHGQVYRTIVVNQRLVFHRALIFPLDLSLRKSVLEDRIVFLRLHELRLLVHIDAARLDVEIVHIVHLGALVLVDDVRSLRLAIALVLICDGSEVSRAVPVRILSHQSVLPHHFRPQIVLYLGYDRCW